MSYILWQYKSFCQESLQSLNSDSQHAEFGACKTGGGCGFFNNSGQSVPGALKGTARTFATAVAGTLRSSSFDDKSKLFQLKLRIDNTSLSANSTIFVSEEYIYRNGFVVKIEPSGAATWSSPARDTIEVC